MSTAIAIPTFRGFLNARKIEMKKAKGILSSIAQEYFKDTTRPHASCQNVLVYRLDDTGLVCFDTDDKPSNDYVMAVMEKYNIPANRNKSVSNVFSPNEKPENPHKFHYWFRTEKKLDKKIKINGTNLDLLTKELVFEPIVEDQFDVQYAPLLTDEVYNEIMKFGAKEVNTPAGATPISCADEPVDEPVDEPAEETEAVDVDEARAFIDANTTAKEAKGYGTWSKVMFKIANKYGKTAQGLEMAIYFSQKDKKKFNREDVKTFWDKIDLSKVSHCVFGLSEVEMRLRKEESKQALKDALEQDKKEKKEAKARLQQEQKEQKEQTEKTISSSYNDAFEKMKAEFEKENFKVIENSCFVQETYDLEKKRKLIQRGTTELNVAFSHLHIKYVCWEENKRVEKVLPFIPLWVKCENIRRYDRMDCYPDMAKCPPNCFNIWVPFEMERYNELPLVNTDEVREGVAFLRNHMSIMCDHQPDTLLEFEKWIAQMIQFPEVKSHMPIFQSKEGSGKGSFFALLKKILGEDKILETESPEEYVWGRFNNMMETAFLVVMNEISKQMTNGGIDKIKGLIDGAQIQIQHKGKGAYNMKSFHRFAGCTNAWDGGITINKGSRRFLMCKMSDEKNGNTEYWAKYRALLENTDVLRGFYNYYKTMEVSRVLPRPINTEFAKELQKLSIDVPTLWVKDMVADAKLNKSNYLANNKNEYKIVKDEYVIELTGKRSCEMLMDWCKENGYSRYETTPIKLGVFLKTKKWAGLIKGRELNYGDTRYFRVDTLLEELADI
jgi:hypothetical protein